MSFIARFLGLVSIAVAPAACGAAGQAADGAAWTPLFNGKDLSGWVLKSKPKDREKAERFWKVDAGTILVDSMDDKNHDYVWLLTEKEYGDFELELRVQGYKDSPGNSGVQVRSRYDDAAGWLDGPQVDLNPPGPWRCGFIYDETRTVKKWLWPDVGGPANAKPEHAPKGWTWKFHDQDGGWNDVRIVCRGTSIKTFINGVAVADYDGAGRLDDADHRKFNVGMRGHIALQLHTGDRLRFRFKETRIRAL